MQKDDLILAKLIENIKSQNIQRYNNYILHKGILFHKKKKENAWKICAPTSMIEELVLSYHRYYGHFGIWKTYLFINELYLEKHKKFRDKYSSEMHNLPTNKVS